LSSFAKFLELLIYSPIICKLTPVLCDHTTPLPSVIPEPPLPKSRLNIIRHFSYHEKTISIKLSLIEDVFELRVPRLQILRGHGKDKERETSEFSSAFECHSDSGESVGSFEEELEKEHDESKKVLRKEIKTWWEGVADHMDRLVSLTRLAMVQSLMCLQYRRKLSL
jgi:1-phosphatidylinositol-3-phosphate 5-kinase